VGAASGEQADRREAVAAARELIEAGARPRQAASVVARLTGLAANGLYREAVTEDERPVT
jgi:hypothetical protein